jgi:phytoene/squalene synthetase
MPLPGADKADLAVARKLLRHGSHSFFAASLLLPRHVGNSAMALYAFCRVADDAIDFGTDRQAELARPSAAGSRTPMTSAIMMPTEPATRAA